MRIVKTGSEVLRRVFARYSCRRARSPQPKELGSTFRLHPVAPAPTITIITVTITKIMQAMTTTIMRAMVTATTTMPTT